MHDNPERPQVPAQTVSFHRRLSNEMINNQVSDKHLLLRVKRVAYIMCT